MNRIFKVFAQQKKPEQDLRLFFLETLEQSQEKIRTRLSPADLPLLDSLFNLRADTGRRSWKMLARRVRRRDQKILRKLRNVLSGRILPELIQELQECLRPLEDILFIAGQSSLNEQGLNTQAGTGTDDESAARDSEQIRAWLLANLSHWESFTSLQGELRSLLVEVRLELQEGRFGISRALKARFKEFEENIRNLKFDKVYFFHQEAQEAEKKFQEIKEEIIRIQDEIRRADDEYWEYELENARSKLAGIGRQFARIWQELQYRPDHLFQLSLWKQHAEKLGTMLENLRDVLKNINSVEQRRKRAFTEINDHLDAFPGSNSQKKKLNHVFNEKLKKMELTKQCLELESLGRKLDYVGRSVPAKMLVESGLDVADIYAGAWLAKVLPALQKETETLLAYDPEALAAKREYIQDAARNLKSFLENYYNTSKDDRTASMFRVLQEQLEEVFARLHQEAGSWMIEMPSKREEAGDQDKDGIRETVAEDEEESGGDIESEALPLEPVSGMALDAAPLSEEGCQTLLQQAEGLSFAGYRKQEVRENRLVIPEGQKLPVSIREKLRYPDLVIEDGDSLPGDIGSSSVQRDRI